MSKNNREDKLDARVKTALAGLFGNKPFGCRVWFKALGKQLGTDWPGPDIEKSFRRLRAEGYVEVVSGQTGNTVYRVARVETGVPEWQKVLSGGVPKGKITFPLFDKHPTDPRGWSLLKWMRDNPNCGRDALTETFMRSALKRGDRIVEDGKIRQVAATMTEQGKTDDSRRVFLSFEGEPSIESFVDDGCKAIRVRVVR